MTPENLAQVMISDGRCVILKSDASAKVGIVRGDLFGLPFDICIKRFPGRGILRGIVKRHFGSRAQHLWDISKMLSEKGLPVPAPVAYFNSSPKTGDSFFISAVIENAENLGSVASRGDFDPAESFSAGIAETIAAWHGAGAVHGDLKWSNVLFQHHGGTYRFFFIDLDQTRLFTSPSLKGICRDLGRFYRYGLELGHEEWVEKSFLPRYLSHISGRLTFSLDIPSVIQKARQDWIKKGSRKIRKD